MRDDLELEATTADPPDRVSVVAWCDGRRRSVGYVQARLEPAAWSLDLVVDGREDRQVVGALLVERVLAEIALAGGGVANLWVPRPGPDEDVLAAALGLERGRELFQMRRPLPVGEHWSLPVRAFRPGEDDERWLEVNNRAFARHPEQGTWDAQTLAARLAEPWFDAEGFLLHERDGVLAGFCWTKVHSEETPALGEIFVIAVDPAFAGQGLGRELTLAGLDHLSGRGLGVGMLYVDSTNVAALGLYERLGFTADHVHRAYTRTIAARTSR